MGRPYATLVLDIPDDLMRQVFDLPKSERGETLSDTLNMLVRKGLAKTEFHDLSEGERDRILGLMFFTARDFPIGKVFTTPELTAEINLSPTDRKWFGRAFANAVKNCQYVSACEKTAQNLSQYVRVGIPSLVGESK